MADIPTPIPGFDSAVLVPQLGRAVIAQATSVAAVDARLRVVEQRGGADWSWLVVALFAFALGLVAQRVYHVMFGGRHAFIRGDAAGSVRSGG